MHVHIRSGARVLTVAALTLAFTASVIGQSAQAPAPAQEQAQPPAPPAPDAQQGSAVPSGRAHPSSGQQLRSLSVDEAVKLALEQNLGIQVSRLSPELAQLAVSQAYTAWAPTLTAGFTGRTQDSPPNSFLSGASDKITNRSVGGNAAISQQLPFGTQYQVGYDSTRQTTNNIFSSFNPQLSGNLDFTVVQPLLRNFTIDVYRLQLALARNDRQISDVALNQSIALMIRQVKNAYWEYKYALSSLDVARQSLELAQQSLRDTRARVEIGTMAPIDVVEAESEVAQREEAVILAEAAIDQSEDRLRTLIFDPAKTPQFWTYRLDPSDPVPFQVQSVDVNGAVMRALKERTDLVQVRKQLENTRLNERYYKNQTLPDLNVRVDYNSTGIAGTQLVRQGQTFPPPVVDTVVKPYSDLLSDVFRSAFPTWTFSVNVTYPLGTSSADVALARARLQDRQQILGIHNDELQAVTEVRDAARQLLASSKRVDATRAARILAERRLDAEQKKFAAGMSTSFLVFQAQRDLAQAHNNELRATLDYVNSQTDFDTVQVAPVGVSAVSATPSGVSSSQPITTTTGGAGGTGGAPGGAGGGNAGGGQ